jgi:uncharacterized protein YdaU (DUF1376 family)
MTASKSARQKSGRDPMDSMPLHVNDWLTSQTAKLLGRVGRDIYLTLLCHQWKAEDDGLPLEPDHLRVLADATLEEWAAVWPLIEKHFPTGDDGQRRNLRLVNERAYYVAKKHAGKAGGEAKASKSLANGYQTASKPLANDVANGWRKSTPVPVPVPASASNEAEEPTASAAAPLSSRFADAAHLAAYAGYRRSARYPEQVDAVLERTAQGHGGVRGKGYQWEHIGRAMLEMQAAGQPFNANLLGGYLRKIPAEISSPPVLDFGTPGTMWTGDGKRIDKGAA